MRGLAMSMFWVQAAFVAGSGLTALLRSRLGLRQFHAGDSCPAVETDSEIRRGQKNPSRERKRAVSIALATLPLSVRIPRASIAARPPRRWRCGLGCGRQPTLRRSRRIYAKRFFLLYRPGKSLRVDPSSPAGAWLCRDDKRARAFTQRRLIGKGQPDFGIKKDPARRPAPRKSIEA